MLENPAVPNCILTVLQHNNVTCKRWELTGGSQDASHDLLEEHVHIVWYCLLQVFSLMAITATHDWLLNEDTSLCWWWSPIGTKEKVRGHCRLLLLPSSSSSSSYSYPYSSLLLKSLVFISPSLCLFQSSFWHPPLPLFIPSFPSLHPPFPPPHSSVFQLPTDRIVALVLRWADSLSVLAVGFKHTKSTSERKRYFVVEISPFPGEYSLKWYNNWHG